MGSVAYYCQMACHELNAIIDQSVAIVREIPGCFSVQIQQQQQQ
jgi:hypothetical protein